MVVHELVMRFFCLHVTICNTVMNYCLWITKIYEFNLFLSIGAIVIRSRLGSDISVHLVELPRKH